MQFIQYRDPVVHHHWPSTLPSLQPELHESALHPTRSLTASATVPNPIELESPTSGWKMAIHLDREASWDDHSSKWRSGEALKGRVELTRVATAAAPITSVIVRSFWQSTTTFVTQAISASPKARMMGNAERVGGGVVEHGEFHRGYLEAGGEGVELWEEAEELELLRREVEGDFPLLGGPATPRDLERREVALRPADARDCHFNFTFLLPTSTRSTFSNPSPSAPANRGHLINYVRTPPPSFATNNGTVQWFVEVLLRTGEAPTENRALPHDLPTFGSAIEDGAASDFRGLLQPSASLTIERTEFPFEPLDNHVQDLNSHWIVHGGPIGPPSFGRDARDELGGSTLAREVAAPGRLVAREGGSDRWTTYEKEVAIKSPLGFGRTSGVLRTEISLPAPAMLPRHSHSLSIILHLSYRPSSAKSFLPKTTSQKPLVVSHLVLVLSERTITRSGRAERPSMKLTEIRRQTVKLWDSDGSLRRSSEASRTSIDGLGELEGGRRHLRVRAADAQGVEVKLEFDLQSTVDLLPSGKAMSRLRDVGLSFRTPNIEREYILVVTVHPVGLPSFQVCRCPIQLLADGEAPAFEDVLAEVGGLVGGTTGRVGEVADNELPGYV